MTDEKILEDICKMAVLGCRRNPQAHTVEECVKCEFKNGMCDVYRVAEKIYAQNYRKLPENAVVLTKEEYELLKSVEEGYDHLENTKDELLSEKNRLTLQLARTRKETAREIVREVKDSMKCFEDDDDGYLLKRCEFECFMREIEKQYGVEVEE